jgi:hypothetical protein
MGNARIAEDRMLTILDPTDERVPIERRITPRTGRISGVIGLLDIRKPRGDVLLDELAAILAERAPDVEVRRYQKPTFAKPCPDELRGRIRDECSAVIEALAD